MGNESFYHKNIRVIKHEKNYLGTYGRPGRQRRPGQGNFPVIEDEFEIIEKKIVYNRLAALPNMLRGKTLIGVNRKESSPLKNEPFPDAVLSISPAGPRRLRCG